MTMPKERVDTIIRLSSEGKSPTDIADGLGTTVSQVYRVLQKNGVSLRPMKAGGHREQIILLNKQGKTVAEIVEELKLSAPRIYNVLKKEGLPTNHVRTYPTREKILHLLREKGRMTKKQIRDSIGGDYNTISANLRDLIYLGKVGQDGRIGDGYGVAAFGIIEEGSKDKDIGSTVEDKNSGG
jgi:DNA-binding CsgD family transcriptional regulator